MTIRCRPTIALALAAAIAAGAGTAAAQSANAGYGRTADQENQAFQVGARDAAGALTYPDGLSDAGADFSTLASGAQTGAVDTIAGISAGAGSTAVGPDLEVVTQSALASSNPTSTPTLSATAARR